MILGRDYKVLSQAREYKNEKLLVAVYSPSPVAFFRNVSMGFNIF